MTESENTFASVWEESFGESPSPPVRTTLDLLVKENPPDEITEAIRLTATRFHITTEIDRIKYVRGILRNKRLSRLSPEKATAKHELAKAMLILQSHWNKQPRGTGYLNKYVVQKWLKSCTVDEIKLVMDEAEGYWAALREEMDRLIESRTKPATE